MQKMVRILLGLLLIAAPAFQLNNINVSAMKPIGEEEIRKDKAEELKEDLCRWVEKNKDRISELIKKQQENERKLRLWETFWQGPKKHQMDEDRGLWPQRQKLSFEESVMGELDYIGIDKRIGK